MLVLTMPTLASPADASQSSTPGPDHTLPNAVPSSITPAVNDGRVFGIAEVGDKMVIGGSFTSVGGQTRNHIAAFNTATGALSGSFAPSVNGDVNAVVPGPNDHTAYIAGSFSSVGGTARQFVALVDLNNGQVVSSFAPPAFNYGYVNDMVKSGGRLYLAGTFTRAGGKDHAGLVSLNANTGALDAFMNVQLSGHHNDTGSGAQGWVGPWDLDVNSAGDTMVVTGNFKYADGLLRDQIAMIDLTGGSAAVNANWATERYYPQCYNWAFDGYVRGVSFSPDGSFFVVNATGGGNNTLCDATARFDTADRGQQIQPVWVNETGGDTAWGVTVTDTAVYVGGHNRWSNNPAGVDRAQPGAVPRPGLGALDPASGRPFAWNPGRRPLGVAVFAMLATDKGLWIGSNNDWIGNFRYKRPKLAFFPYAGGYQPSSTATSELPGAVYLAGAKPSGASNVLYRVNAGGTSVQSLDSGPDWSADDQTDGDYRNSGSNAAPWSPGATVAGNVPATTPGTIFDSERWSPSDTPAMNWAFPVASGTPLQVRLYFANRCTCTDSAGERKFDVSIDGSKVLDDYDIVADVGDQVGTMKSYNITSDGSVNIDFAHAVENPLVNGIEIVRTDVTPPPNPDANSLVGVDFDGTDADAASLDNQGIDFGNWRGAFKVGGKVFYGYTDGYLYYRTFDGDTFGPAIKVDPYNDPDWSDVDTDLGQTFRGVVPSLYSAMPNVTSMMYADGKLFYTLFGDSRLFARWFTPDSGIMDERTFTISSSVNFSQADGMFLDGSDLYYATKNDKSLHKASFDGTSVTGSGQVVSGPDVDGVNWSNRALFLDGSSVPANEPPTARAAVSCNGLSCSFDGADSSDPEGPLDSYSWDFGDGSPLEMGPQVSHTYAAGEYDVVLTVADSQGVTDSVTKHVSVSEPQASSISFVGSATGRSGNFKTQSADIPTGVQPGDAMLMMLTRTTPSSWSQPSGWTEVDTYANASLTTTVWRKTATAADVGSKVTMDANSWTHSSLNVLVYRGVDDTNPLVDFAHSSSTNTTAHTAPNVTAGDGDWVVSIWGERSGQTTAWTAPSTLTQRDVTSDSGSLTVTSLAADSDGPVAAGTFSGSTAETDVSVARGIAWSLVLRAAD
ncbi:hypothetical protein ASG90_13090 [Nocardioides sp. Soil797]|nr:hypothetical protein ASG90_13090 [Nocardioides sp. Soil797]